MRRTDTPSIEVCISSAFNIIHWANLLYKNKICPTKEFVPALTQLKGTKLGHEQYNK